MADEETKQVAALKRRKQQIKRWNESETSKESEDPKTASRVSFQDGCVFLAACSSGDKDEVKRLLERGADINTANVDGMTALHQACIDGNLDMVEFLVDEEADLDACDNEGWTALHAVSSCGYTEIARYLLKHGAYVAAVNNDGDLAIDIADDEEMQNLLQEEMDKKDVDAEAVKREEEDMMMEDANRWLLNSRVDDCVHPKTGATALHVASAKGYVNVMNVLLQAGVDVNAQDVDGWTPLHAAAHWAQEDACQILVDHLCDMEIKNQAGHTAFDLSDSDMLDVLEDLKKKQVALRKTGDDSSNDIMHHALGSKRRSSVTRMSSDQKHNVITKTGEEERATLDAKLSHLSSSLKDDEQQDSKTPTIPSTQDAETERKNERNRQSSLISLPQNTSTNHTTTTTDSNELAQSWRRGLRKTGSTSTVHDQMSENDDSSLPRSASSPRISVDTKTDNRIESIQERLNARRPLSSTLSLTTTAASSNTSTSSIDSRLGERYSWSGGQSSYTPYRDYLSRTGYKPFYQRQQEINQQKEQERSQTNSQPTRPTSITTPSTPYSPVSTSFSPLSPLSPATPPNTTATTTTAVVTNPVSTSTGSVFKRSYEPPKRDEETETQRKARAKHARQTRRSTQGVSLEDLEKAEKVVSQSNSSRNSTTENISSSSSSNTPAKDSSQDVTNVTTTGTTTTTTSSSSSSSSLSSPVTNDKEWTNNFSNLSSSRRRNWENRQDDDSTTRTSFRRPREDKDSTTNGLSTSLDITSSYVPRSQRNAFATSDVGSSSPSLSRTSSLHSRLRNESESASDVDKKKDSVKESKKSESSTADPPVEKKESAASRARRKRNERRPTGKVDYVPEDLDIDKENQPEDGQKDDTSENSSRLGRYSASDVPSDSSRSNRPVSYSEYSRSTNNLDEYKKMYEEEKEENGKLRKELENCKKDMLEAKAELDKLMKQRGGSLSSDSSDKREKRALERKVSEYEEELKQLEKIKAENKKLREENRALTRVVSKLSK